MKKASIILALAAALFAACGQDESKQPVEPAQPVPDKVRMSFTFDATDDMLRYLDITVVYDDGTGEHCESVDAPQWSKSLTAKLPSTITYRYEARVKAGMYETMAAAEAVSFTRHYSYAYDIIDVSGAVIPGMGREHSSSHPTHSGVGSRVAERYNEGNFDKTYTYTFDANGRNTTNDQK